ncbi:protein I'm not dead yet-like [Danaus plexippus]|uniref:protein I'm not dead yet-like n=1 Tax=Danaus plexippus TaxID=13037 RepID=UPI0013C42A38|nr:protein I'm not dead yet-like [Danaus plexippus]
MFGYGETEKAPPLEVTDKLKIYLIVHWRGIITLLVPLLTIGILVPFPPEKWQWTAYCLLVMAVYWVTECIPLPVTAFLPVIVFPITGVMTTTEVCKCYVSDAVIMFLGSLMLAASVEQSGLHRRMAFVAIRSVGYSHRKLLVAMVIVTSFCSMWITNTAATTMMMPIIFAVLKVFEDQKLLNVYDTDVSGSKVASDIASCYFCTATFSATIGGVGTLIGTGTNLVFKGLFVTEYPNAPDYLSFPLFSAFGIPYMIVLDIFLVLYILIVYTGLFRPNSEAARKTKIPANALKAAEEAVAREYASLGKITFWEKAVIVLFGSSIILFFCRSPQIFKGWGDLISDFFELNNIKFVRDSAVAACIITVMLIFPSNLLFFKNCSAKFHEDLPKKPIRSVLDWAIMMAEMPFSFVFLLGGGFALSTAAKLSGLNSKIGECIQGLKVLPDIVIVLIIVTVVIMITNFASNIAVCNVFTPISMQLAREVKHNPLMYCIASGFAASHCFLLPVGTPGNLIVQSAAKVPTSKMAVAGIGPTISTIIITWLAVNFYAPIVWPILKNPSPDWLG